MRFVGQIGDIPFTVDVNTDNVSDAVSIATRMRAELDLIPEPPEDMETSALVSDLRHKAELFRSAILRRTLSLLADAIGGVGGSALIDFDDEQFALERNNERTVYAVECFDGGTMYTCATFTTRERAKQYVESRYRIDPGMPFAWVGTDEEMQEGGNWECNSTGPETLQFVIRAVVHIGT